MIQKIKTRLVLLSSALLLSLSLGVPAVIHAQDIQASLCDGANFELDPATATECVSDATTADFQDTLANIINILSIIIGVIAVIMIIFGGFRYMTSGGDSTKVTSAKNTLLYAIIGLIIVDLAQVIVRFVLNQADDL